MPDHLPTPDAFDEISLGIADLEISRVKSFLWKMLAHLLAEDHNADPAAYLPEIRAAIDRVRPAIEGGNNGGRIQDAWVEFCSEVRNLNQP